MDDDFHYGLSGELYTSSNLYVIKIGIEREGR